MNGQQGKGKKAEGLFFKKGEWNLRVCGRTSAVAQKLFWNVDRTKKRQKTKGNNNSVRYVDGRPHKTGEAVFSDGSRFSGTFKDGIPEKGDWTLNDGSTSISGKFSGLRLTGRGV